MKRYVEHVKVILILPSIAYLLLLLLFPGVFNLYAGFHRWTLGTAPKFVGLENFVRALFYDERFHHAFLFTTLYAVVCVTIELCLGLALALMLYSVLYTRKVTSYVARVVLTIPFMVAPIAAGYMWRMMFHGAYGVYTFVMEKLGLGRIDIYADPNLAFWGVVLIDVWQWTPFVFLVLYSGLNSLPPEPFEAAMIDGARGWKLFRYITFPMIKPLIIVVALLRVIDAYKVFDTIYIATGGGPGISTEALSLYIYERGLHGGFELGYTGAIAWLYFMYILAIVMAFLTYFRRVVKV